MYCPRRNSGVLFFHWAWTALQPSLLRELPVWGWKQCDDLSEPEEGCVQLPVASSGPFKLSEMKIFLFAWSRLEGIFCHLHLEEFWQIQVSKEENDYSGISSGFCSQWNRVMLAVFVFKYFLQILKLRSVCFRSGQQKQISGLILVTHLLSPSHMLGWRWQQEGTRIFNEHLMQR